MITFWVVFWGQIPCLYQHNQAEEKTKDDVGKVTDDMIEIIKKPQGFGTFEIVITQVLRAKKFLILFGQPGHLNRWNKVENGNDGHQVQVHFGPVSSVPLVFVQNFCHV